MSRQLTTHRSATAANQSAGSRRSRCRVWPPSLLDVPVLGRFLIWLRPDYGGLIGAACFFCWSLTPTLLPRTWGYQAMVSGLTATIGYALGVLLAWLVRLVLLRARPAWLTPSRRTRLIAWWAWGRRRQPRSRGTSPPTPPGSPNYAP